ncbi:MAG: Rne/Rng family ribonuclease [Pseudomonadota bacterium]|nr:Rne/Rng family ribonuclease [Pseudomonadota bacterium]
MKRMLINATHEEELRVALVDGQKLYDLDIEKRIRVQKKSNIYKAKVTRVEPSLEAAFVDYGGNRHGFLPLKEISREYFSVPPGSIRGKINIQDVIKENQELIVQVDKEERGSKGAALTTMLSLAGRYLVLMPNNSRAGGISRRIEGQEREALKESMSHLDIPKNMGVIIRTAGVDRTAEELQWDLDYLLNVHNAITNASEEKKAPFLIYQESDVITRAVRDYLKDDIGEIQLDTVEAFEQANQFIEQVMPHFKPKLKMYSSDVPLFNRYQIESQIETAFNREVRLPSGGSLVIDPTEALVSIDINSSRATRGADIEDTALNTNLEAATEICRQLRLRDIGGLVVIDFIDMLSSKNQRMVENRMREELQIDRARVQIGRISQFGLLEMSRQRLRPSLGETSGVVCPRCDGLGSIRDVESSALAVLRMVEEEALKETSSEIRAFLPISVSSFVLNEKRKMLLDIEQRNKVSVIVVPDPDLDTPHYKVERIRSQDSENDSPHSYEMERQKETESREFKRITETSVEEAAVKKVDQKPRAREKSPVKPTRTGLLNRLFKLVFGEHKTASSSRDGNQRRNRNIRNRRPSAFERGRKNSLGSQSANEERGKRARKSGHDGEKRTKDKDFPSPDHSQERGPKPRKTAEPDKNKTKMPDSGSSSEIDQNKLVKNTDQDKRARGGRKSRSIKHDNPTPLDPDIFNQSQSVKEEKFSEKEISSESFGSESMGAKLSVNDQSEKDTQPGTSSSETIGTAFNSEATDEPIPVESYGVSAIAKSAASASKSGDEKPINFGRVSNDPRISPRKPAQSPVLENASRIVAEPYLADEKRIVSESHPSKLGRAKNDPRKVSSN